MTREEIEQAAPDGLHCQFQQHGARRHSVEFFRDSVCVGRVEAEGMSWSGLDYPISADQLASL